MVSQLTEILDNDIEVVIRSPHLSLSLLKCASVLLLHGAQPRACERSQRMYYSKLKLNGMAKAEMIEKAKNRTCIPNFTGFRYSKIIMAHISSDLLSDEMAIEYLQKGALKESDFNVLPQGYNVKLEKKQEVKTESQPEEVKTKKRGRKPKADK